MADPPPRIEGLTRETVSPLPSWVVDKLFFQSMDMTCNEFRYRRYRRDKDDPQSVKVSFLFDKRWSPKEQPKKRRRNKKKLWRGEGAEMPLRVGLWSKFHSLDLPAESEEASADHYTLRHAVEHYPQAEVVHSFPLSYRAAIRGSQAIALVHKIRQAHQVGWTDDGTGQSSYLVTIDERLREAIGDFMKICGVSPLPASETPPR